MSESDTSSYPRFSDAEFEDRRRTLAELAVDAGVSRVIVYGANRAGSAVQWLTNWPVTREAAIVWDPAGGPAPMFVQYPNHAPMAREVTTGVEVRWGGPSTFASVCEALGSVAGDRIGFIGPLPYRGYAQLADTGADLVDLNRRYTDLRLIKSDEELDWMRRGAALSDAAVIALEEQVRPGITEFDLADIAERAYVPRGGTTQLHFFGVTSMQHPSRPAPLQYQSNRVIEAGDAVSMEISAAYWGYAGQVLRTFAVASEPTSLFQELHDVADACFDALTAVLRPGCTAQDLVDASGVVEEAGFTICDDLVHGYGGGYLPPVLGTRSRPAGPVPDLTIRQGMTMVIQPNVVTPDLRAGVQTGELVRVTADGWASMHRVPRGLRRVARADASGGEAVRGHTRPSG